MATLNAHAPVNISDIDDPADEVARSSSPIGLAMQNRKVQQQLARQQKALQDSRPALDEITSDALMRPTPRGPAPSPRI